MHRLPSSAEDSAPSRLAAFPFDFSSSVAYSISFRLAGPKCSVMRMEASQSTHVYASKGHITGPRSAPLKLVQADVFPYHRGSSLAGCEEFTSMVRQLVTSPIFTLLLIDSVDWRKTTRYFLFPVYHWLSNSQQISRQKNVLTPTATRI